MTDLNLRRLLNKLTQDSENLVKHYLYSLNSPNVNNLVKSDLDHYFDTVVSTGQISDYTVICDSSNNSPSTVSANQLNVDILVAPDKTPYHYNIKITIQPTDPDDWKFSPPNFDSQSSA